MSSVSGKRILVWGRHELYVGSLAVLLSDLGARVHVLAADGDPPQRLPVAADLVVLESPLPFELRCWSALGPPLVVVAEHGGPERELAAAQLGAGALVEKGATLGELTAAIARAQRRPPRDSPDSLTPRQRQVLELIVEGLDNRQIAQRLGVSERTAPAHTSQVLKRLGEPNRTRAAVTALRRGLLSCIAVALTVLALAATATATPAASPHALARMVSAEMSAAGPASGAWIYDVDAGRQIAAVRAETP